jgi:hypothetical protein
MHVSTVRVTILSPLPYIRSDHILREKLEEAVLPVHRSLQNMAHQADSQYPLPSSTKHSETLCAKNLCCKHALTEATEWGALP